MRPNLLDRSQTGEARSRQESTDVGPFSEATRNRVLRPPNRSPRSPKDYGRNDVLPVVCRLAERTHYFGDLVLFSGLALLTGRWAALAVPALMLAGFLFVNIPVLDRHLSEKYGADFARYASHTSKLVPFVY